MELSSIRNKFRTRRVTCDVCKQPLNELNECDECPWWEMGVCFDCGKEFQSDVYSIEQPSHCGSCQAKHFELERMSNPLLGVHKPQWNVDFVTLNDVSGTKHLGKKTRIAVPGEWYVSLCENYGPIQKDVCTPIARGIYPGFEVGYDGCRECREQYGVTYEEFKVDLLREKGARLDSPGEK